MVAMPQSDRLANVAKGLSIMQQFDWKFPTDHLTSEFDAATEAFTTFSRAISHLQPEDDLSSALWCVSAERSQMLAFLSSMYRFRARTSYRRPIVECIYNMWKRDAEFRELLELQARQSLEPGQSRASGATSSTDAPQLAVHDNLPWLGGAEWRTIFEIEVAADASTHRQLAESSQELVRQFAPLSKGIVSDVIFLGRAQKCFRCGQLKGYLLHRKGFGWRERTHDARCRSRMRERRSC